MSKRKKLRTSGGEGVHPPKPPKNSRRGNTDGAPQTSELDCLPYPESTEGKSGPRPSAELNGEELAQAASSSPEEDAGGPPGLLGLPAPGPFPLSQNPLGKFVPQFAKPRKTVTVTRQGETKDEDVATRASHPETPPEPGALQAGSQALGEPPGRATPETSEPGRGGSPEPSGQGPSGEPEPHRGEAVPVAPSGVAQEGEPSASSMQEHLSGGGHASDSWPEAEGILAAGDGGSGGHLPSSQTCGAPGEGAEGVPGTLAPRPAAQGAPDLLQTSSWPGGGAVEGRSSQGHSSPGPDGADVNAEPAGPAQVAPEGRHGDAAHTRERTEGRAEPGRGDEPPRRSPAGPRASLAPALCSQEPAADAAGASPEAPDAGPEAHRKRVPGPGQGGPSSEDMWPPRAEPAGASAAKGGSKRHEVKLDLERPDPSFWAPSPAGVGDGPAREPGALRDGPEPRVGPDPADQASWGGCAAMELSFLPDSQIQEALDAPGLSAPPEQVHEVWPLPPATRHPAAAATHTPPDAARPAGDHGRPQPRPQQPGAESASLEPSRRHMPACWEPCPAPSGPSPRWPGPSPPARGDPEARPRAPRGTRACEACSMEDATATVRGLVVELSNLNRLIMGAHRDLEACRRLSYRRPKPAPHAPKGAAAPPREQPWRDL